MKSLSELTVGKTGRIKCVSASTNMRRRFLDIGLVENTLVCCVGKSPSGDPKAYLIRGAVIAIRSEDCKDILIEEQEEMKCYGSDQELNGD